MTRGTSSISVAPSRTSTTSGWGDSPKRVRRLSSPPFGFSLRSKPERANDPRTWSGGNEAARPALTSSSGGAGSRISAAIRRSMALRARPESRPQNSGCASRTTSSQSPSGSITSACRSSDAAPSRSHARPHVKPAQHRAAEPSALPPAVVFAELADRRQLQPLYDARQVARFQRRDGNDEVSRLIQPRPCDFQPEAVDVDGDYAA